MKPRKSKRKSHRNPHLPATVEGFALKVSSCPCCRPAPGSPILRTMLRRARRLGKARDLRESIESGCE